MKNSFALVEKPSVAAVSRCGDTVEAEMSVESIYETAHELLLKLAALRAAHGQTESPLRPFARGATHEHVNGDATPDDEEPLDFYSEVQRFESRLLEEALRKVGGCQACAARRLKLKASTIHYKIKQYGIHFNTPSARGISPHGAGHRNYNDGQK